MSLTNPANAASFTDALCANCGLCCDGSLFADVELAGADEADGLEAMGLEIEDGDSDGKDAEFLVQPCRALKGTRCSVYAHRPECCRTFECRLLRDAVEGRVSVEEALAVVADARAWIVEGRSGDESASSDLDEFLRARFLT